MPAQKNETSEFILKLIDMINVRLRLPQIYQHIIGWNDNFTEIIVKDLTQITITVLPKYFRHSKFESFVRQLNMYNFHKVCREKNNMIHFKNDLFYKGNEINFCKIKRKKKNEIKPKISYQLEQNIKYVRENCRIQPQIKQLLVQLLTFKNDSVYENKRCLNLLNSLSDQIKASKLKKLDPNISEIKDAFQQLTQKSEQIQILLKQMKHSSNDTTTESIENLKNSTTPNFKLNFENLTQLNKSLITKNKFELEHYKSSFKLNSFRSITSYLDIFKEQKFVKQQDHKSVFSIQLNEQDQ